MKRIAVFASREGTNTQHLIDHFKGSDTEIALVVCNNPNANVLLRATNSGIPSLLTDKDGLYKNDTVLKKLQSLGADLIVCAGFLWKVPATILKAFPDKVVNVHPALLPNFGGKGMYGLHVHKAVIAAGEKESGITLHYVNEQYDEGKIILQKKCAVDKSDTPESLAQKVQKLEHEWLPKTIETLLTKN